MTREVTGRTTGPSRPHPGWIAASIVVLIIIAFTAVPGPRHLAGAFFQSLRQPGVQAVNVNLSSFVGPNANPTVQQMISQMISANVTTTVSEKTQNVADSGQASQLAGFRVQLLGARGGTPELSVTGRHSFQFKVDRARLQAILKEAGRSDLVVPQSIDGAAMSVQLPRMARALYGNCPRPARATANIATPPPSSTQYDSCVLLMEGPRPQVTVPQGLDVAPLAEIGLEAAGMTVAQARTFLHSVNWRLLLGVAIPRSLRSYDTVRVNGVQGTLFNLTGRRGPTYRLIWIKTGIVYSLSGYGDPAAAVTLADTLA